MTDLPTNDWVLLAQYFAGECSLDERMRIDAWSAASPERQNFVATLRAQWEQAAVRGESWDAWSSERGWQEIAERMKVTQTAESLVLPAAQRKRSYTWRWSAGASAAACIAIGVLVVWHGSTHDAVAEREYATAPGQRLQLKFADGTQVTLGPASRLLVPSHYTSRPREIDLTGEALFTVVHETEHPFAVLTHGIKVTDVGTEFDVRGYDDDGIRVAVSEGAVALVGAGRGNGAIGSPTSSMNGGTVSRTRPTYPQNTPPSSPPNTPTVFQEIPLSAGDMADVTDGVPSVTHHANIAAATAWAQGRLVFNNVVLRDAVKDLSRTFDLDITVADTTLDERHVTGSFDNLPADQVLTEVTHVIGAQFERHGRAVVIRQATTRANTPTAPAAASLTTVLAPHNR